MKITYTYKRSEAYRDLLIEHHFGGMDENNNITQKEVRYFPLKAEFGWTGLNDTVITVQKNSFNSNGKNHKIEKISVVGIFNLDLGQKWPIQITFFPDDSTPPISDSLCISKVSDESVKFLGKKPYGQFKISGLPTSMLLKDLNELFLIIEYNAKYKTYPRE